MSVDENLFDQDLDSISYTVKQPCLVDILFIKINVVIRDIFLEWGQNYRCQDCQPTRISGVNVRSRN